MEKSPVLSVHQINVVTGDIKGNLKSILKCIEEDNLNNVEISIFPETAISGYMCGSLWDNEEFLKRQQNALNIIRDKLLDLDHKGFVVIGFVRYAGNRKNGMPLLYNSVAVLGQEYWENYDKRILASSHHHEDKKYFTSGNETKVFELNLPQSGLIRIGTPICEDMWYTDHTRNIPVDMVEKYGANLIININQSYFYYGKQQKRYDLLKSFTKKYKTPVIYCNSVGVGDIVKNIVIFSGGSMVMNEDSELISEFPQFTTSGITIYNWRDSKRVSFSNHSKYEEITNALLFEQKEFFKLNGIKKAQVHISGGLDSAIVAALVQKAMGVENTILITNPTNLNVRSEKYVHQLMNALGNTAHVQPLQKIYETFMEMDKYSFGEELSDVGKASVQAVLRTVQGLAATHRFGSGIVATGNHTEIVLGWASFHDIGSIGVHALIGDLTKIELYELCEYINGTLYGKEVIPKDLYDGTFKPSAELPDAPGDDPIDYKIYSGICALLIRERNSIEEASKAWKKIHLIKNAIEFFENADNTEEWGKEDKILIDLFPDIDAVLKYSEYEFAAHVQIAYNSMKRSVYKAAQSAPIVIMSPRSRGFSNRETLINKYSI